MRIGINISNALHRRLKAIGEPVNVSQVCRDAIENIVAQHEQLAARVDRDDLRGVTAAFATDDDEQWADIDWREYGWTDARDWFRKVTREQYDRFVYDREFYLRTSRSPDDTLVLVGWAPSIEGVAGFYGWFDQHRDMLEKEYDRLEEWGLDGTPHYDAQREYNTAWLEYFGVVHKLIEEAREERMREKQRRRAQFPEPELPTHLV